jgi:hypothetical protein
MSKSVGRSAATLRKPASIAAAFAESGGQLGVAVAIEAGEPVIAPF